MPAILSRFEKRKKKRHGDKSSVEPRGSWYPGRVGERVPENSCLSVGSDLKIFHSTSVTDFRKKRQDKQ